MVRNYLQHVSLVFSATDLMKCSLWLFPRSGAAMCSRLRRGLCYAASAPLEMENGTLRSIRSILLAPPVSFKPISIVIFPTSLKILNHKGRVLIELWVDYFQSTTRPHGVCFNNISNILQLLPGLLCLLCFLQSCDCGLGTTVKCSIKHPVTEMYWTKYSYQARKAPRYPSLDTGRQHEQCIHSSLQLQDS